MNNEVPTMQIVKGVSRFLIDTWANIKCPTLYCSDCEYNNLCKAIADLSKAVNR